MADTRRLGLDVRLSVEGSACDVPDSVGVTVYRVAQEALTNTLKHAGASTAVVSLRYRDRAVELEVSDDVAETRTPTMQELILIREVLDPRSLRDREVPPR